MDAVHWGELDRLRGLLEDDPRLVARRSSAAHHATLLHYVAANGVERERQLQSPANAPEIARLLLERGAEPDALCDTYDGGHAQTTLCLLVSSVHPADAGVQAAVVEELCRGGARVNGLDDDCLPLWTAVTFGYTAAAEALARAGARVDDLVLAAALGDLEAVQRLLTTGPTLDHALVWASAHDRREVVTFLLAEGADPTFIEPRFGATAIGAARYHGRDEMVALLAGHAAEGA